MQMCWNLEAAERPTFSKISQLIERMLGDTEEQQVHHSWHFICLSVCLYLSVCFRRYRSIRARSARLLNSFFPQAVRALNSNHTAPLWNPKQPPQYTTDSRSVVYRFILFYFVLYICIYVAPWSCETRHLVPLYVHTSGGCWSFKEGKLIFGLNHKNCPFIYM